MFLIADSLAFQSALVLADMLVFLMADMQLFLPGLRSRPFLAAPALKKCFMYFDFSRQYQYSNFVDDGEVLLLAN